MPTAKATHDLTTGAEVGAVETAPLGLRGSVSSRLVSEVAVTAAELLLSLSRRLEAGVQERLAHHRVAASPRDKVRRLGALATDVAIQERDDFVATICTAANLNGVENSVDLAALARFAVCQANTEIRDGAGAIDDVKGQVNTLLVTRFSHGREAHATCSSRVASTHVHAVGSKVFSASHGRDERERRCSKDFCNSIPSRVIHLKLHLARVFPQPRLGQAPVTVRSFKRSLQPRTR